MGGQGRKKKQVDKGVLCALCAGGQNLRKRRNTKAENKSDKRQREAATHRCGKE